MTTSVADEDHRMDTCKSDREREVADYEQNHFPPWTDDSVRVGLSTVSLLLLKELQSDRRTLCRWCRLAGVDFGFR